MQLQNLIQQDRNKVNNLTLKCLHSEITEINQIGRYIINQELESLPSTIFMLAAGVLNYKGDQHIRLAAIIDLIYTAICFHVSDGRSNDIQHNKSHAFNREAPRILLGDYLYSKAFYMMADIGQMRVVERLSHAIVRHTEGRALQLPQSDMLDSREKTYLRINTSKATLLFEVVAQLAAILNHSSHEVEHVLADYGKHFGLANQISKDLSVCYRNDSRSRQKIQKCISSGNIPLPIVRMLQVSSETDRYILEELLSAHTEEAVNQILFMLKSTDALQYTQTRISNEVDKSKAALRNLPTSSYCKALTSLADDLNKAI